MDSARDRLLNGLAKLKETNDLVDNMKEELAKLQPVLEEKSKATAVLLEQVTKDQAETEKTKLVVEAEEAEVKSQAAATKEIADDARSDLDKAMPALNAAVNALSALNKNDITEIKSFAKPPALVQMTMEAVCILKQEKPDWDTAKRMLGDSNFMKSLMEFDKDHIPENVVRKLKKYVDDPNFQPDIVAKQSNAAKSLCMWCRAMDVYHEVAKVVEPKRVKLREAEASLAAANATLKEKQDALAAVIANVESLKAQLSQAQTEQKELNDEADLTKKRLERAGKLTSALADEGVRWKETSDKFAEQIDLLVGDVFVSSACVAYYGAFTGPYRDALVSDWLGSCKAAAVPTSEAPTLRATLASPVEVRDWNIWGLPTDDVSINNGILVTRGKRWPLMIDPQGQANTWVKNMEAKSGLRVIKLTDGQYLRTLENSIRIGNPVLVEDVGEALDPALEPVLLKQTFQSGGRTLIRLGDTDIDYDPNFRFYVTTKLANPHYLPEVCIKVTIINFTVTMKGLEDQLLGDVVRKERPDLEEQKDRLVVSISNDKRQLNDLEDKILKLLKESEGNILDDEVLINTLNNSKLTSGMIQGRVKEAEQTETSINEAREFYRPAANRGSILYFVIADLALIGPMYQYSLTFFNRMFNYCIDASEKHEDVSTRLSILSDFVTKFMYNNVQRGLFEEHKLLFGFLMCVAIKRGNGTIANDAWNFFLRGAVGGHDAPETNPAPSWLSQDAWNGLAFLEKNVSGFAGIVSSFQNELQAWESFAKLDEPQEASLPDEWEERIPNEFHKLLVIRLLRDEKLVFAVANYVRQAMGAEFTEPAPWRLEDVYPDTSCRTPVIFILSTGADPTAMLQRFSHKMGWTPGERLHMISLGQGQGRIAEMMVQQAASKGDWVCLQNCHLAKSWMLDMETMVEELSREGSSTHPDFRLWLTSMPAPTFPVVVLQNGIKLTNEPPKGVKANINRTYNDMSEEGFESCAKSGPWKKLLFSLSFFHAVIQERRKFGPLGWNIRYEFNSSDLECSMMTLRMFLEEQEVIPWAALEYVVGQINYGGRVTDDNDRRCLMSILRQYITPKVLEDSYAFTVSGTYFAPPEGPLESHREYIRGLPASEAPEVFGMHPNANISYQKQESAKLLDTALSIQPRVGGGASGGKSSDEIVAEMAAGLEADLPAEMDIETEAALGLFDRTESGQLNSLSVVLGQEIDRFNRLTRVLGTSLAELQKAIRGLVVMTFELEAMFTSMLNNAVPEMWSAVAYPSLKPLASWMKDYHERIAFMRSWLQDGVPKCFWLPGFFFPQGFMTGCLQMHARKYSLPIDALSFGFEVTPHDVGAEVRAGPEDGIYVNGLWIDSARWDRSANVLEDSRPGEMFAPLPVIHFRPQEGAADEGPGEYSCPLYKTSVRAGVLSTTGQSTNFVLHVTLPIKEGTTSDYWVLQGVALLCALNT